jgi:hypothetical protein
MKKYFVEFTATFRATIELQDGESLTDAVADLNIPESEGVEYITDSFDVESVEDEKGNYVDPRTVDKENSIKSTPGNDGKIPPTLTNG